MYMRFNPLSHVRLSFRLSLVQLIDDMDSDYDVHEDTYDTYDPEEDYYGPLEDNEELGDGTDDDGDGDYIPGRRGVDDDDDDEDDFEEEDEDEDLDRQLDAEDAAEAMEDLHNIVEAEQEGERTTIAQLLQSSGALPTAALYP